MGAKGNRQADTEYELVFEVPEVQPFKRVTTTGRMHIADHIDPIEVTWPYRLVVARFRSVPVTGWLIHSLCVGVDEQLLGDTGVPLEIFIVARYPEAITDVLVRDGEPVTMVLSHRMAADNGGLHGASVHLFVR